MGSVTIHLTCNRRYKGWKIVHMKIKDKSIEVLNAQNLALKDNNTLLKYRINQLQAEVKRLQRENKEYQKRLDEELINSVSEVSKDALAVLSIYKIWDVTVLREHQIRNKLNKYLRNVKVKPALDELKFKGFLIPEDEITYKLSDKAKSYKKRDNKHLNTVTYPAQTNQRFDALFDRFSEESRKKVKALLKMWPEVLLGRAEFIFMRGKTMIFKACAYMPEYLIVRYRPSRVSPEVLIDSYGGERKGETVNIPLSNLEYEDLVNFVFLLKRGDTPSLNKVDLAEINSWAFDS